MPERRSYVAAQQSRPRHAHGHAVLPIGLYKKMVCQQMRRVVTAPPLYRRA